LSGHVRQFELHRLKLADRLPKLLSLLGVFRGRFERALCHPQRQRRDRNSSPSRIFRLPVKPSPSGPSKFSCGTRQSLKITSDVSLARIPSLFPFFPAGIRACPFPE